MVIILKRKTGSRIFLSSLRFKFIFAYVLFIIVLLALLNLYPPTVMRNIVFTTKKTSMAGQLSSMTASLSSLEKLSESSVSQALDITGVSELSRILVTGPDGKILYDASVSEPGVGRYALFSEIARALTGKDIFRCTYNGSSFLSRSASPIVHNGTVIGAIYIHELDTEQASIIARVRTNLLRISLIVFALAIVVSLLFSKLLTSKVTAILAAIKKLRGGEYGYRADIHGKDEISQLGREFNDLSERLKMTEEMRRRFVSDASHELKTPLASIRLLSDSIVQSGGMDEETVREFVTDIGAEAERLTRTTEKLLALTRLDSNAPTVAVPVNVSETANRVVHMLKPLADSKEVTLRTSISDSYYVMITPDELYTVIHNLVENAIKYNVPDGSVHLMVFKYNELVRIVVDDTGIGIPEEDIGNIFVRFYRVDKARSREAGGSGLGLSIVKDTVLHYGGTIDVSRREPGTRFRICFPAVTEGGEPEV